MIRFIAGLSLASLASLAPASAQRVVSPITGNGLLEICTDDSMYDSGRCAGFISGTNLARLDQQGKFYCVPETATNGQIRDVIIAWLKRNPGSRHIRSDALIAVAYAEAWPCPKGE